MNENVALTAQALIEALSKLDPDTPMRTLEHDSEWMCSYEWAVTGVSENGYIRKGGIVRTHEDFPEDFAVEGSPS